MIEITLIQIPEENVGFGVSIKAPGEKVSNFTCTRYEYMPFPGWLIFWEIDGAKDASVCHRFDICRLFEKPKG
jgi:hypothetical protein